MPHAPRFTFSTFQYALVFSLIALLLTGCDVRSVDPVIKIGLVAPFEGEQRQVGYDIIYSARLAVREVNAAGGINGTRLSLVAYDDSTNPEEAKRVAQALVVDEGIIGVVGHWAADTNAAAGGLYDSAELAFVPMGVDPFGVFDAAVLSDEWRNSYQAITYQGAQPPGLHAATAYDAMQLLFAAIESASESDTISRTNVYNALSTATIEGLTGTKSKP
ncbi:MAG: ABC transporter substrate-binding protein [Candidatus Promineifilaceae bacterium]